MRGGGGNGWHLGAQCGEKLMSAKWRQKAVAKLAALLAGTIWRILALSLSIGWLALAPAA